MNDMYRLVGWNSWVSGDLMVDTNHEERSDI
jgi:hypothetical protein